MSTTARSIIRPRVNFKVKDLSTYHVATVAVFATIFVIAIIPRFDADIWWHLFVGRDILTLGSVPTKDFLSYTFPGKPWIDHEWLSEVMMYAALQMGGVSFVFSLFAAITTSAFIAVYALMRSRGVNNLLALTLTFIAAASCIAGWGARVQMITLLFTAVFGLVLDRYQVTGGRRCLIALGVMMLFWANMHGGFVIGLVLIAAYIVGRTLDGLRNGWSGSSAWRAQRPLLFTLLACTVIPLLNPNTYQNLLYPLKFVLPNAFTNVIQESQSPNFHLFQMLPFELLVIGLVISAFVARRRASWIDIVLVVIFTHLAFNQVRNVALWAVVVTPVLAVYLQDAIQPAVSKLQRHNKPVRTRLMAVGNWGIICVTVLGAIILSGRMVSADSLWSAEKSSYPMYAIRYLQTHQIQGHVFNSYAYGGYLIWNMNDRYRVFIDSRADTVYDAHLLNNYEIIYGAKAGWQGLLTKYDIKWVFVERDAQISEVLSSQPGWKVVWQGKLAKIIEKTT